MDKPSRISFLVERVGPSGICSIGVCYRNIVQQSGYCIKGKQLLYSDQLNSGAYALRSDGYAYSHSLEQENSKLLSRDKFEWKGARMGMELNPATGVLAFSVDGKVVGQLHTGIRSSATETVHFFVNVRDCDISIASK